jgi:hypothetical protein
MTTLSAFILFYFSGLFIFSLLGLVWMAQRRDIQRAERAMERAQELVRKYVRTKSRRGY